LEKFVDRDLIIKDFCGKHIDEKNSCDESIIPKLESYRSIGKNSKANFNNVTALALSRTVF
jgi:hypothetical protein